MSNRKIISNLPTELFKKKKLTISTDTKIIYTSKSVSMTPKHIWPLRFQLLNFIFSLITFHAKGYMPHVEMHSKEPPKLILCLIFLNSNK